MMKARAEPAAASAAGGGGEGVGGTSARRSESSNRPRKTLSGVLLQVLRQCNYACSHCSQGAPRLDRASHLTLMQGHEVVFDRIRVLAQIGHPRLRFTGGEPFLYSALRDAVELARGLGLEVSFVTNASHIGRSERRWLRASGPLEFWISFYGFPPTVHDRVCGRSRAFDRALSTLSMLLDDGHQIGVHYPLSCSSLEGAPAFVGTLGGAGVRAIKIMQLFNQGRAQASFATESPDDDDLEELLPRLRDAARPFLPAMSLRVSVRSGQRLVFESNGFVVPESCDCHAGLDGYWTVDADGGVYPCCLFLNTGEMRTVTLGDPSLAIWVDSYDHQAFLRDLGLSGPKTVGPLAHCPALSKEGKDPGDEFICPLTYARLAI